MQSLINKGLLLFVVDKRSCGKYKCCYISANCHIPATLIILSMELFLSSLEAWTVTVWS